MNGEALADAEVAQFAVTFPAVRAEKLLWQVGFPDGMIPSTVLNAGDFWTEVSRALASGVFPGGRRRLLAAAYRLYPANDAFAAGRLRRVMLVGASPDEGDTIRADRELRELRAAARLGHLEVSAVLAARISDLRVLLRAKPDVLHLSTHGDGTHLFFESPLGERQRVPVADVTATLAGYRDNGGVRLTGLVLASCHGESAATAFLGVAESVVAYSGLLDDACAVRFAGRLYEELYDTPRLLDAARQAAEDMSREGDCDVRAGLITVSAAD